jgi:hypothetical protein
MNFLIFISGVAVGVIVATAVTSVLWDIKERALTAENEVLATENGVLRQQVNASRQLAGSPVRPLGRGGLIPGQAAADLGGAGMRGGQAAGGQS